MNKNSTYIDTFEEPDCEDVIGLLEEELDVAATAYANLNVHFEDILQVATAVEILLRFKGKLTDEQLKAFSTALKVSRDFKYEQDLFDAAAAYGEV